MNKSKSIEALIKKCRDSSVKLHQDYQAALTAKEIGEELKIDIKNIFENLRSCLDYIARDIYSHCLPGVTIPKQLYFPIRQSSSDFKGVMNHDYPGLQAKNPAVYTLLESFQPYHDKWLGKFNDLNNMNKHQDLVQQTIKKTQSVKVSKSGGSVSWGPGVKFGSGVSVMGVPIDPQTQMPVPNNVLKTEVTIWVDFRFREIDESVLPFIEQSIKSVEKIYTELNKLM